MGNDATTRRKRDVSAEDFKRLLATLDPDPMRAWQAYDQLRQRLVKFFKYTHGIQAEELAEEALDRIAKRPDSHEIENVMQFAFGVARHLRMEASRKATTVSMPASGTDGDFFPARDEHPETTVINKIDNERKIRCFLHCMRSFAPQDRQLILQYHPVKGDSLEERRQKLAETLGINGAALRTRVSRLKHRLDECFRACCAGGGRKALEIRDRQSK